MGPHVWGGFVDATPFWGEIPGRKVILGGEINGWNPKRDPGRTPRQDL